MSLAFLTPLSLEQDSQTRFDIRDRMRERYAFWERLANAANEHNNEEVEAEARKHMQRYELALLGLGYGPFSAEQADREAREIEDRDRKPWRAP